MSARPDVLIGQAYFLRFDRKLWTARQPYAPLGSLYAAACVRQAGYDVAFFDAMLAASEDDWVDDLDRLAPRLAVLFEDNFNYLSKMCLLRMRQAAIQMIGAACERGVPVVVAGSDASDHPELYLDAGADVVITGEGEATLVDLLACTRALGMEALVEVNNAEEMAVAVAVGATLIGINNRDLRSFNVDLGTTDRLARLVPAGVLLAALSGISTRADVERFAAAGAGAVLVGEALMRADDPARMISDLRVPISDSAARASS